MKISRMARSFAKTNEEEKTLDCLSDSTEHSANCRENGAVVDPQNEVDYERAILPNDLAVRNFLITSFTSLLASEAFKSLFALRSHN